MTTERHPFYVNGHGFIEAGMLKAGAELVDKDYNIIKIEEVRCERTEGTKIYNFQVEGYHTYCVGEEGILVHNADCGTGAGAQQKQKKANGKNCETNRGSSIPVKDRVTTENGLDYQSNPKHTQGQIGNRKDAGLEPQNSLDLFSKSVDSSKQPGVRFAYDESTGTLHRFADSNNGSWHWNGSTNQGRNSLNSNQVPTDIIKKFNLPKKGW